MFIYFVNENTHENQTGTCMCNPLSFERFFLIFLAFSFLHYAKLKECCLFWLANAEYVYQKNIAKQNKELYFI